MRPFFTCEKVEINTLKSTICVQMSRERERKQDICSSRLRIMIVEFRLKTLTKHINTKFDKIDINWCFGFLPILFPLRHIPNSNSIFNVDISGNYKVQLYDPRTNGFAPSSPGIGMHVEVRDPDDKIILSKVYSSEGKWTFTSHTPGEHVVCLYTNSTKWFAGTQLVSNQVLL